MIRPMVRPPRGGAVALPLILLACVLVVWSVAVPRPAAAFDPPGLAADAGRYAAELARRRPVQPDPDRRDRALVGAFAALAAGAARDAVRGFEAAIAEGDDRAITWLALSRAWTAGGLDEPERALEAAWLAYRRSAPDARVAALVRMAELLDGPLDRPASALEAYRELAAANAPVPGLAARVGALARRVGLTLKTIRVTDDEDPPRACLAFSAALSDDAEIRWADFVDLAPPATPAVTARDDRLCLAGLDYGTTYRLTVREGLPGAGGLVLRRPLVETVRIGNRAPFVGFGGSTFLLPRHAADAGLPLVTVNLDRVAVALYRIDDRNLVGALNRGRLYGALYDYAARELENRDGELLWRGELAVTNRPNALVTTAVPIRTLVPDPGPGLYVVVAEPIDVPDRDRAWRKATQWLMVTDFGLTALRGDDGVTVFVRSLASAAPRPGVEVALVARNNDELGRATTDRLGRVTFPAALTRGSGGKAPVAVMAYGGDGDFALLDLTAAAFDLTDRGVAGRAAPGPLDLYLYTERGVYRPGETVHLSALVRDPAVRAVDGVPLTLRVIRPSGTVYRTLVLSDSRAGGHAVALPLTDTAPRGSWTVRAFADPEAEPIAQARFLVEDFVPERLAVEARAPDPYWTGATAGPLEVAGRFLYGPPAAGLEGRVRVRIDADPAPFPAFPDHRFGLAGETVTPRRAETKLPTTDPDGVSLVVPDLPALPDVTVPLRAVAEVELFEPGGRPTRARVAVPVRVAPFHIGLKPDFARGRLADRARAAVEVVVVDPAGRPQARQGLRWELMREHHDFQWYYDDGRYSYRVVRRDESLRAGSLSVVADAPGRLALGPFDDGRYRLEVFDPAGAVASSLRFSVGWWVRPESAETPDEVTVTVAERPYRPGDTARVHIAPPFAGTALVAVVTDRVHHAAAVAVPADGTTVEVPVSTDWGPGAYVLVSLARPPETGDRRRPVRAVGLAWVGVDPEPKALAVSVVAPETVRPRGPLDLAVRVVSADDGRPVADSYVTIAAVDEGILSLTDFQSPDPHRHYLGKRALGLDVRDDYGRLIETVRGPVGRLRQGGGAAGGRLPEVPITVVSLFEGPVAVGADGRAAVRFALPAFNGALRLMAVAWSPGRVGGAVGTVTVRDRLVVETVLPRFLAPGDDSQMTLSLHAVEAPAGTYRVAVDADGPIKVATPRQTLALGPDERIGRVVPLRATGVGIAELRVSVTGPEALALTRTTRLTVRSAAPVRSVASARRLAPGATSLRGRRELEGYLPGSAKMMLTYSSTPPFNVAGLLDALDRFPYGCLEQTVSRALPLLYVAELARRIGVAGAGDRDGGDGGVDGRATGTDPLAARVDRAIGRVLDMQRFDGAFGLWTGNGAAEPWLTGYAVEFLTRARSRGHSVPDRPYLEALRWLGDHAVGGGTREADLASRAYALYALSLAGVLTPSPARYFHDAFADRLPTPIARAQVAAALARLGDRGRARAGFDAAAAALARRPWHVDYGSTLRDVAALVSLVRDAGIADHVLPALVERLPVADLAVERTNTQEQAWLVLAADGLGGDGGPLALATSDRALPTVGPVHLTPSAAELARGVMVQNIGRQPVWEAVAIRGIPRDPEPARREGLFVRRYFFDLDGKDLDLDDIHQNDVFVMVLEAGSTTGLFHRALITHGLPAGWEIENSRLGAAGAGGLPWLGRLTNPVMAEARDDRYVAAVNLDEGAAEVRLAFLVRAVTPGVYQLPGGEIVDLYQPSFFARQAPGRLAVLGPRRDDD